MIIQLDHFTKLLDLALRLPGRLQYDIEVTALEVEQVGRTPLGPVRVQVFADDTARDYIEHRRGRLTIRAWGPTRPTTPEERRRLQIKLVDACVDARGEPI